MSIDFNSQSAQHIENVQAQNIEKEGEKEGKGGEPQTQRYKLRQMFQVATLLICLALSGISLYVSMQIVQKGTNPSPMVLHCDPDLQGRIGEMISKMEALTASKVDP